ncbi:DsbE family thiol:disulfide interchange protein [Kordiimonas sp. SCSIO 12610]|uniref:DsbE family thiol:disulfide interchange protein n=1 Tax=Kordiimonas sp. SCSIO 12610 TaxID=2829597 RepID=UPI00210B9384|nr:DsbE family thiol:disulfide interchange protein [Kordiimonas sp. SCSIO 12610]UTW55627.1 DsbE family thiol:disulfide interchange protein [Kordiimonas sp. SCSIO 12610]
MQRFLPLLIVIGLVGLFAYMLRDGRNPSEIKNIHVGEPAPEFSLADIGGSDGDIDETILKSGSPVLVNFFASWCVPCRAEHDSLMELANTHNIKIIGIAYKDKPEDSRAFLEELGNPFEVYGGDLDGVVGFEWGVTGVPETFIVDGNGRIRYHHYGPIVGDALAQKVLPEFLKVSK